MVAIVFIILSSKYFFATRGIEKYHSNIIEVYLARIQSRDAFRQIACEGKFLKELYRDEYSGLFRTWFKKPLRFDFWRRFMYKCFYFFSKSFGAQLNIFLNIFV